MKNSKHKAAIPNPALTPLSGLLGEWETTGRHPYLPEMIFHGYTSIRWMEGGSFLIMHSEIEEDGIPSSTAVFGSDDAAKECFMLYFDEREVSRKYDVSFQDNILKWWRNIPGFSQRFTGTFHDNGNTMNGMWELCKDGATWEKDLELTYKRV